MCRTHTPTQVRRWPGSPWRFSSPPLVPLGGSAMRDHGTLQILLDRAVVDVAVWTLRPDYRALLLAVEGIEPGAGDAATEQLLVQAETAGREALSGRRVEALPHVAAWRQAYRAFGAKPQRTRSSLEALLR